MTESFSLRLKEAPPKFTDKFTLNLQDKNEKAIIPTQQQPQAGEKKFGGLTNEKPEQYTMLLNTISEINKYRKDLSREFDALSKTDDNYVDVQQRIAKVNQWLQYKEKILQE